MSYTGLSMPLAGSESDEPFTRNAMRPVKRATASLDPNAGMKALQLIQERKATEVRQAKRATGALDANAGLQAGHQIIAVNDTPVITATNCNKQRKWILQQIDLQPTIRITVLITAPSE